MASARPIMRWATPALFLLAFYLPAPAAARDIPPPEPYGGNWGEFCKSTDCTQFPRGYATYELDGKRLYLPLFDPDGKWIDAYTGTKRGQFFELDKRGRLITSRNKAGGVIELHPCCEHFLKISGLKSERPNNIREMHHIKIWGKINSGSSFKYTIDYLSKKSKNKSTKKLIKSNTPVIGEHFWLL